MRVSSLPGGKPGEVAQGVEGGDRGLQERAVKSPWASETRFQQAEVTAKSRDALPPARVIQGCIESSRRVSAATRKRLSFVTAATNKGWTPGHCCAPLEQGLSHPLLTTVVRLSQATCQAGLHGLHLTPVKIKPWDWGRVELKTPACSLLTGVSD